jgi:hypothetical protein
VLAVCVASTCTFLTTASSAEPREDAVKLADQGFDRMEEGKYAEAAKLFERAVKLYYTPVIALYWAKAEAKRGRLVEAREIVTTIESRPLPDGAQPSWTKAVEDAAIFGVELDGRIPTVTVEVDGPPGATVRVDDEKAVPGRATKVNPGEHVVTIEDGGNEKTERFVVSEKETHTMMMGLDTDGGTSNPSLVWPIVAFSVAGAGLVIGTVTGIIFAGKASDLEDACPGDVCPPEEAEKLDETKTLGNVSTAMWIIAGLGAAAGTVLLFVPLGEGEEPVITVRATPVSASVRVNF